MENTGAQEQPARPQRQRVQREQEWIPKTELGRMVKGGKISSISEIFRNSIRIQEAEIVDFLLDKKTLVEDLIAIKSVQKQSKAGQKTSMKVCAVVGNKAGFIGIGSHSAREYSVAAKGAILRAKMNIIPIRMGQWDGVDGPKHTVTSRTSGKCGSVTVKLVPAPKGTGIEYSDIHRRIFELAGIQDIFVKSYGRTKTSENLARAIIKALENSSNTFVPAEWDSAEKIINPLVAKSDLTTLMDKTSIN